MELESSSASLATVWTLVEAPALVRRLKGDGGVTPESVMGVQGAVQELDPNVRGVQFAPEPDPVRTQQRTAEKADLRSRSLEDLEENIPVQERTATPVVPGPKKTATGGRFLEEDLDAAGPGVNFDQARLDEIWEESIVETGKVAGDVIDELADAGKIFKPKDIQFWDAALHLPGRARFWYEVSAEAFRELLPDLSDDELATFIDLVAATSPQADPNVNIRRAVGAMSQDLRRVPIDQDLTNTKNVTAALSEADLEGLKIGSFSNTFQYHLGLDDTPPLSTNDRQVASSFGIEGDDIAGNDVAYELLSRFYIKMRNELNRGVGGNSDPFETWQVQALGWVQERIGKGNNNNDDYLQALEGLKRNLEEAGIELPDGKLTREVLMDPRVEQVTATTLEQFRASPIVTVETATTQTSVGARAAEIAQRARETGDPRALAEYETIVRRSLKALITRRKDLGNKAPVDLAVSAVTGKASKLSRMELGHGTFEGTMSLNARIPLSPDLTEVQRRAVLAILGRGLKQDAVPASLFRHAAHDAPVPDGQVKTYSIFIRDVEGAIDEDMLLKIQQGLPAGHDVNVVDVANGRQVDINPRFQEDGSVVGPTPDEIDAALDAAGFSPSDSIEVRDRHYSSDYLDTDIYNGALTDLRRELLDDASKRIAKEFGGDAKRARRFLKGKEDTSGLPAGRLKRLEKARDRYQRRISDSSRAGKADREVSKVARGLGKDSEKFNERFGSTLDDEGTQ